MSNTLSTIFNHERYQAIAVIIICLLLLYFYGCESKVHSISNPEIQLNRVELDAEVNAFMAKAEAKYADLDRQDKLRALVAQNAMLAAQGTKINPTGVLAAMFSIFGIGAAVDNVRKRKEIKDLKNGS